MEPLYKAIAYFLGMPKDAARLLRTNPANPLYGTAPQPVVHFEPDVIPETVRRSAGMKTPSEGTYVVERRSHNSGHRG